jgi:nucleoid-associated protein YgaU
VGSPDGIWGNVPPASYGVHAKPVAATLKRFGLQAEAQKGMGWDALRGEIAAGRPVIVWVVGSMWPGQAQKYTASNGKTVTVAAFEHTMIVVGYDRSLVHVVDAYSGLLQVYPVQTFLTSWTTLGRMAVTGGGKSEPAALAPPAPPPSQPVELGQHTFLPLVFAQPGPATTLQPGDSHKAPGAPDTYTVKRGDFLMAVARRFGLDWRQLADLNGLSFPYTLYSGQVLRLK